MRPGDPGFTKTYPGEYGSPKQVQETQISSEHLQKIRDSVKYV